MSPHRFVVRRARRWPLGLVAALATTVVTGMASAPAATAAAAPPAAQCRDVQVPVSLGGAPGQVSGTLCTPAGARTVQVLVPGFSYNRQYWDWPQQPERYSYTRSANAAGYATLALDPPGTGASTHPLSALDTFTTQTEAVHQVIQAVRTGTAGSPPFSRVVLGGHSYGSITAMNEAGQYHDVNALVITGGGHRYNAINLATFAAQSPPAGTARDTTAGNSVRADAGYVIPRPDTRSIMHAPGQTDPAVYRLDQQLRDTGTLTELATVADYSVLGIDRDLNIPVFTINGTRDAFFCNPDPVNPGPMDCSSSSAMANAERGDYGPHAHVEAATVPGAGHALNLEHSAPAVFGQINGFLNRHLGP